MGATVAAVRVFWFHAGGGDKRKTFMEDNSSEGWFSTFLKTAGSAYQGYTAGEQAKADKKLANAINNRVDANATASTLFSQRNIIIAAVGLVVVVALVMFTRK